MPQQYYFESLLDDEGKITVPANVLEKMDLHPGDCLQFLSVDSRFIFQLKMPDDRPLS